MGENELIHLVKAPLQTLKKKFDEAKTGAALWIVSKALSNATPELEEQFLDLIVRAGLKHPERLIELTRAIAKSQIDGSIWFLTRHPESEGNVDPKAYALKNDHDLGITEKGIAQAKAQGKLMLPVFDRFGITDFSQIQLHSSTYNRPQCGLNYALESINETKPGWIDGEPKIFTNDFNSERYFGLLQFSWLLKQTLFKDNERAHEILDVMLAANKEIYKKMPYSTAPLFGESRKFTALATKFGIQSKFNDIFDGQNIQWHWEHGDVIKGQLKSLFHTDGHTYWDTHEIGNCDTFAVLINKGDITVQQVIDGEKMCLTPGAPRYRTHTKQVKDLPFWQATL